MRSGANETDDDDDEDETVAVVAGKAEGEGNDEEDDDKDDNNCDEDEDEDVSTGEEEPSARGLLSTRTVTADAEGGAVDAVAKAEEGGTDGEDDSATTTEMTPDVEGSVFPKADTKALTACSVLATTFATDSVVGALGCDAVLVSVAAIFKCF